MKQLKGADIRVEIDDRSETMQSKIRDAQSQKIPYMIIVGDNEEKDQTISIRKRSGENMQNVKLDDFLQKLKEEIATKSLI
jgi:threonyl-tRNA synthetase